jgi:hypothetical protein
MSLKAAEEIRMFRSFLTPRGRTLVLALLATGTVLLAGCSDDEDDDVDDDVSVVTGRVAGGAGNLAPTPAIVGATVSLARIDASGNLVTVSDAPAVTDAQGNFRLETDLDNVRNLVVVADKGSTHLEAIVPGAVQNGQEITSVPLTTETTLEAQVWKGVVADNRASTVVYADVAAYVTPALAGNLSGNAASIEAVTTAIETEATARNAVLADASFGISSSELATINNARATALANFADDIAAADTQAEIDAAWQDWYTADAQAYLSSGLTLDQAVRLTEISSRAYVNSVATLNSTTELSALRGAALTRAGLLRLATLEAFTDAGTPNAERTLVANAGATLVTSINNAATDAAVATAFDTYHDTLLARLQAVYPSRATAIASGDAAIYAPLGPRETLTTAVATSTDAGVLLPAYMTYYDAAETSVSTALAGATATELELVTRVLVGTTGVL